jgi:hypothetical protein
MSSQPPVSKTSATSGDGHVPEADLSAPQLQGVVLSPPDSLDRLDPTDRAALAGEDHRQDIKLKKSYARTFLWLVSAQLAMADLVFIAYAWAGRGWNLPTSVIEVWLGATLVELIGVVLVVTRYLFPRRDGRTEW